MPNEEPEGPNLPPPPPPRPKSADITDENGKCNAQIETKNVKIKGIIGAVAAAGIMISYLVYYYWYYNNNVKLNELYFISSGIGISVFTGLLFTFFKGTCIKTILLFTCVFYAILELIYIVVWVWNGQPYAYIKLSLIAGLFIGLIYFAHDKLTNKPRNNN